MRLCGKDLFSSALLQELDHQEKSLGGQAMLSRSKVESGLVAIECPDNSVLLPAWNNDEEPYTLREMIKEYLFPKTTRKKVPETPRGFSVKSTGKPVVDRQVNLRFAYDVYIYETDKSTITDVQNDKSILRLSHFEDISKKKNKQDSSINMQKYSASDLEGYVSLVKEESHPIAIVYVDKDEITETFDLLSMLNQNGVRIMILTSQNTSENIENYKLHCKSISLIIDKIQKEFINEEQKKQIHLLSYKSTVFPLHVYLSYKGMDTNITSATAISNPVDELTVLESEDYLHMDLSTSQLDSKIARFRAKTPLLSLYLNKTFDKVKDKYHKNRNPWICRCTKFYDDAYLNKHNNSDWYAQDVINWISAWTDFDVYDSFDLDLKYVDPNWFIIKQEGDDFKSDNTDSEREDFINEEYDNEYNLSINDKEVRVLTKEDLSESQKVIEERNSKLEKIINKTVPENSKMKFPDMTTYFQFLTYSLFIEELYTEKICMESYIKVVSSDICRLFVSTKQTFETYVQNDMHHLKKHAFARDQPIYIFKKSDTDLEWKKKPDFWIARVLRSDVCRFETDGTVTVTPTKTSTNSDKDEQISMFTLRFYSWNNKPFPKNEKPSNFAFLPGSIVLGRVFSAMENITNPVFTNLILGKTPIETKKPTIEISEYSSTLNDSQKKVINSALVNNVSILKGPPGTGKTTIIHETILQLLKENVYPIMVVAASNLAVDNIAEKLKENKVDDILRVCSKVREQDYNKDHKLGSICLHNKIGSEISGEVKDIESRLKEDMKNIDHKEFSKYHDEYGESAAKFVEDAKVILTTTASIAHKYIKDIPDVPVIIMDEATQSSEPLSLIAMGVKGCSKLILVGDPEQLSVHTKVKALEMSLFERVLNNGICKNPLMLDTQYRMHPDISEFPKSKFYDNVLKDGVTAQDRTLKKIRFPVFFYDHQGIHAPETKTFSIYGEDFGLSWSNKAEVRYVVELVEILIRDRQVSPSDIGIMTGYSAQRELLIRELKRNSVVNPDRCHIEAVVDKEDLMKKQNIAVCDINGLIVASVDAFQGREKKFIIMSCVRSNDTGNIGFMTDRRRMNVALTRAQYSMILVGNAQCFSKDKLWGSYIKSLEEKDCVRQSMYDY